MNAQSAKSSLISCARIDVWRLLTSMLVLVALVLSGAPAEAKKKKKKQKERARDELFNPFLGIEHSHLLQGALGWIATDEEVERFLELTNDEEAEAFVEAMWAKRAEGVGIFEKKPRQTFEERASEADRRYSEGALPGRATDRGAIYIVHGEPEEIEFRTPNKIDQPYLEVWTYPGDAPAGLDGESPKGSYLFFETKDGRTIFYKGQKVRDPNYTGDPRDRNSGYRGR